MAAKVYIQKEDNPSNIGKSKKSTGINAIIACCSPISTGAPATYKASADNAA